MAFEYYLSHYFNDTQYYHYTVFYDVAKPGQFIFKYYQISDNGYSATVGIQNNSMLQPFPHPYATETRHITSHYITSQTLITLHRRPLPRRTLWPPIFLPALQRRPQHPRPHQHPPRPASRSMCPWHHRTGSRISGDDLPEQHWYD